MKFLDVSQTVFALLCGLLTAYPSAAAEPEIKSFLDAVPQISRAQPALKPVGELIERGVELQQQNKAPEAKKAFADAGAKAGELLKTVPRGYYDELYELKGFAEQWQGDLEAALKSYEEALRLRPSNPLLLFRCAFVLSRLNRCAEALPKFQEVLWSTQQARHEILYLAAECNKTLGNTDLAFKQAQEAQKIAPVFLPVLRSMVTFHQEQIAKAPDPTQKAAAEAQLAGDLSTIVRLDPKDRQSALTLVRLLIKSGDILVSAERLAEAEELAAKFAKASDFGDEESVKLLFDAQLKRGNLEAARKTAAAGLTKNPKSALMKQANQQLEIEGARDQIEQEES